MIIIGLGVIVLGIVGISMGAKALVMGIIALGLGAMMKRDG